MGITDKQLKWLEKHYKNTRNREICAKWGWTKDQLRYIASKYGLKKTKAFKRKMAREALKIKLTAEQEEWLRLNFANTKNEELSAHLGISMSTMHRFASSMKLKKDEAFVAKCQANSTEAARTANMINGWPPKGYRIPKSDQYCFKKGVKSVERFGAEKEAARLRKAVESLRKRRESERRRVLWGLPQLTRLKVVPESKRKRYERWYLRNHGYMIDEEERVAYWDEKTRRAKRLEMKNDGIYEFAAIDELMDEYHEEFRNERDVYMKKLENKRLKNK